MLGRLSLLLFGHEKLDRPKSSGLHPALFFRYQHSPLGLLSHSFYIFCPEALELPFSHYGTLSRDFVEQDLQKASPLKPLWCKRLAFTSPPQSCLGVLSEAPSLALESFEGSRSNFVFAGHSGPLAATGGGKGPRRGHARPPAGEDAPRAAPPEACSARASRAHASPL